MSKKRIETWIAAILVGGGLLAAAIPGLWMYMYATATPLHPDAKDLPSVPGPAPLPEWGGAVDQGRKMVRAALTKQNLPGLSVAVGARNDIVWAEGFGFADIEKRVPVTPSHRFRIGTASIVLTSAAVGLLLEQGGLRLDDVIQMYVPAFPEKQWPVTLRQLMGHFAGVKSDGGDESPLLSQHCEQPVDALKHFAESPLLFEPGTECRYSRYGWIIVSAAVEAAAGEPFLTFMQKRVFDPAGMRETTADSATQPIPDRVTFYFPRFAADPTYGLHLTRDLDYSCYAGSSVFLSTPSDLVRFGQAINSGKLLRAATVELLQTSQRLASGKETDYGLGWDLETVTMSGKQTRVAGHNGDSLGGMLASLITLPERGIVVAVTSNISYADTYALALHIAEAFMGQLASPAGE